MTHDAIIAQHRTAQRYNVLRQMAADVREVNEANGWFDGDRSVGDGMALLHEEVAEAFSAWRKHGFADRIEAMPHYFQEAHCARCGANREDAYRNDDMICGVPKPEGYGSELADVLIRLLDQADRDGVDLVAEFERKLAYNATRGYRHGNRRV